MKKQSLILVLAVAVLVAAPIRLSHADTLRLDHNDTRDGDLIEISGGTIVFRTALAGQTVIPLRRVRSIATDSAFEFILTNGKILRGRLQYEQGIGHSVLPEGEIARPLDLRDIHKATPVSTSARHEGNDVLLSEHPLSLDGSWGTGFLQRWGDRNYGAPFARLTLLREAERYHFRSTALFEVAGEDDFPRLFRIANQWRFHPDDLNRPLFDVDVERDTTAALDLRASMTIGVERRFLARESHSLEGDAGLNVTAEYFDRDSIWNEDEPTFDETLRELQGAILLNRLLQNVGQQDPRITDLDFLRFASFSYYAEEERRVRTQDLNLRFHLQYRRIFPRGSSIAEELSIYPSITNPGALRARSESSLQVRLAPRLNLKLNLLLDYDEEPAFASLDQWRTAVGASVVLNF